MGRPVIVTGDDVKLAVSLFKNEVSFSIDPGADVKASLITPGREMILIAPTVQSSSVAGADWNNSVVVVEFSSAQNDFEYEGEALVEIQVDDGGKLTFFPHVQTAKGTID